MTSQPDGSQKLDRIKERLSLLYGSDADAILKRISRLVQKYHRDQTADGSLWDETDVVLITYGDQVHSKSPTDDAADSNESPLQTQHRFLLDRGLTDVISLVHILPFSPFSSDDGFSVIDFREVNPEFGSWEDVRSLGEDFDLVFDLVLNHASQHSDWFRRFLKCEKPYDQFFITADPNTDLSQVTRPRSLPLLTEYETVDGPKHVWTTFSADQVDLNYRSADLLLEMLDILLMYSQRGARIVRLDAIAYLWKEIGTSCIHLPKTHEVVKLMRDVLEAANARTLLLSETNVPHAENVSYFGEGDEAHLVYQFSLPPLLLDAFLRGDATPLNRWLVDLEPAGEGTTYFNFTASHDGIGVRPLEGLVEGDRLAALVADVKARGGRVSTRRNPDGTDSPYELNITYLSALGDPDGISNELHCRRFISSQAVMLALRGLPAIYFHSLVGTANDQQGVSDSGIARRINRKKYLRNALDEVLDDSKSLQSMVFNAISDLIKVRRVQPAFHPDADQLILQVADPALIVFQRQCAETDARRAQRIVCVTNVSSEEKQIPLAEINSADLNFNVITGQVLPPGEQLQLDAFQTIWLTSN